MQSRGRCSRCARLDGKDRGGSCHTLWPHHRSWAGLEYVLVTQHRRLSVCCPTCGMRVVAPAPEAARGTPFGPRLHAVATYLKTFQALSYERLQAALSDLFGLTLSQGGLMNLLRRAQGHFAEGQARDRKSVV